MGDTTFSNPMNVSPFLQEEPNAELYLRPYVGSREFLQGGERWILALQLMLEPQVDLRTLPKVRRACCRLSVPIGWQSRKRKTYPGYLLTTPTQSTMSTSFHTAPFLVIPKGEF